MIHFYLADMGTPFVDYARTAVLNSFWSPHPVLMEKSFLQPLYHLMYCFKSCQYCWHIVFLPQAVHPGSWKCGQVSFPNTQCRNNHFRHKWRSNPLKQFADHWQWDLNPPLYHAVKIFAYKSEYDFTGRRHFHFFSHFSLTVLLA